MAATVTPLGTPGTVSTVTITAGVPTAGSGTVSTLDNIFDATNGPVAVKAASTAPVAADKALVVAISPNGINPNISDGTLQVTATHTGAPIIQLDPYSQYEAVAASTTAVMGATGAQYDYLSGVLIVPGTAAAGVVQIKDGNGTAITIFAGGGTTPLPTLAPIMVPLGIHAMAATSPGWSVITNANVTAIGIGRFT